MYLETAPGISLVDSIYAGIKKDISYSRATIRSAIQQLEDQHSVNYPTKP